MSLNFTHNKKNPTFSQTLIHVHKIVLTYRKHTLINHIIQTNTQHPTPIYIVQKSYTIHIFITRLPLNFTHKRNDRQSQTPLYMHINPHSVTCIKYAISMFIHMGLPPSVCKGHKLIGLEGKWVWGSLEGEWERRNFHRPHTISMYVTCQHNKSLRLEVVVIVLTSHYYRE